MQLDRVRHRSLRHVIGEADIDLAACRDVDESAADVEGGLVVDVVHLAPRLQLLQGAEELAGVPAGVRHGQVHDDELALRVLGEEVVGRVGHGGAAIGAGHRERQRTVNGARAGRRRRGRFGRGGSLRRGRVFACGR